MSGQVVFPDGRTRKIDIPVPAAEASISYEMRTVSRERYNKYVEQSAEESVPKYEGNRTATADLFGDMLVKVHNLVSEDGAPVTNEQATINEDIIPLDHKDRVVAIIMRGGLFMKAEEPDAAKK